MLKTKVRKFFWGKKKHDCNSKGKFILTSRTIELLAIYGTQTLTTFVVTCINRIWYCIPVYLQNILKYQNIPLDNLMM